MKTLWTMGKLDCLFSEISGELSFLRGTHRLDQDSSERKAFEEFAEHLNLGELCRLIRPMLPALSVCQCA